jgi:S-adenosylmethionine:tRNA ribosyltransferase-isomerase
MSLSDFDYELPNDLIAQSPAADRGGSRLLIADRADGSLTDVSFVDIARFAFAGDVLILNNTKVFPARLVGHSETGAKVEVFLVQELTGKVWEVLAKPARRLRPGKRIIFDNDLAAIVLGVEPDGKVTVEFESDGNLDEMVDKIGKTPLPPYIKRDGDLPYADSERYQTVYASKRGAIAAPTAGLHFTPAILSDLRNRGVVVVEITLHVGYGTFEPIRVQDLTHHRVRPERYEINGDAAAILNDARAAGRRLIAVGTTTIRAIESNLAKHGVFVPGRDIAELTIVPGFRFQAFGALLTNFHLPQSSLLVLTSTFAGHDLIMDAYRHAVANRYRFYSYGDCMLII